jgi:hypothetical protein
VRKILYPVNRSYSSKIVSVIGFDTAQPGKVYFGNPDTNAPHIEINSYIESSNPVYAMYEVYSKEAEHNLIGADAYMQ